MSVAKGPLANLGRPELSHLYYRWDTDGNGAVGYIDENHRVCTYYGISSNSYISKHLSACGYNDVVFEQWITTPHRSGYFFLA